MTFGSRFLGPVFKRKRRCFAPFSKRFASTLIVFLSFSVIYTTTPIKRKGTWQRLSAILDTHGVEWSGARSCLFDVAVFRQHRFLRLHWKTAFSESIVFKSLQSGERFRMAPFSVIVFGVVVWTVAVSSVKQLCFRLKTDQCGQGLNNNEGFERSKFFPRVRENI